jgi:transketolase
MKKETDLDSLEKLLEQKAYELRKLILNTCINAGKGHVTSCMSSLDILIALYHGGLLRFDPKDRNWSGRDKFILSKGQASPALYTVLADVGFYDSKELDRFAQLNGIFGVHLQNSVPGVEITAGSLGQGFGVAAGIALGAKMNCENHLTYALLGDGELYEGSIWETAMFAAHNRLNNLITIVDRNYQCVMDFTESMLAIEPLEKKWESFGFEVIRVNGHCYKELLSAIAPLRRRKSSKPTVIIADTIKGEGVESIACDPMWHGVAPQGEMAQRCLADLDKKYGNR